MMRITGGSARGILLTVPEEAKFLRPATDFLREAVFSSLGQIIQRANVLDLFAGVGSYGLDALSRGAESCVFVEKNRQAIDAIADNIRKVKKSAQRNFATKFFCQDVFDWYKNYDTKFDLIFIDPPYSLIESQGNDILDIFSSFLKNGPNARIIIEVPGSHKISVQNSAIIEMRRLGRMSNSRQPNALIYGNR